MTTTSSLRRAGLRTWLPALLFALAICLSVFATWNTSLYCLDGDVSSELVLAHHLNETGRPLTRDWYYSSELRVLNTQLVFAPLFSVFSDWHMVRFVGTLILQALMILSFFYLGRQAELSWGARFLGGTLLLLPVSVTYGRFVLYQAYYIPHIAIGFATVALFLSGMKHLEAKRIPAFLIRLALLLSLSLASGLGGVRQGVVTHVPLVFLLLVYCFQDAKEQSVLCAVRKNAKGLALACAACAAFALGYIVNSRYLSSAFSFRDYNTLSLGVVAAENSSELLFSVLHFFGFREGVRLLSPLGILSLGAVFSGVVCVVHGVALLRGKQKAASPTHRFISLLALSAPLVMLCIYLLVELNWYYALYLLPAAVWFIPLIASAFDAMPDHACALRRGDICMLISAVLLVANGLANSAFFATHGKLFPQRYHGIGYENMTLGKELEAPVSFLTENGYDYGYADFWTASPITEVSDGSIDVVNILINCYDRPLVRYEHLMQPSLYGRESDKAFLLLTSYHDRAYATMPYADKGERVYDDGNFVIYHFDDPSVIRDYTSWEYVLP